MPRCAMANGSARRERLTIGGIECRNQRNVVDPESIIKLWSRHGSLVHAIDSPPERDIEWTRLAPKGPEVPKDSGAFWGRKHARCNPFTAGGPAALELRASHRTLAAVTDDLSSLRFNRAIARI
jgi:leucyl-tRNA synthetase